MIHQWYLVILIKDIITIKITLVIKKNTKENIIIIFLVFKNQTKRVY